jgi:hypothetical protein
MAWMPPEQATLIIHTGDSRLLLPVRTQRQEDDFLAPFPEVETAPAQRIEKTQLPVVGWHFTQDLAKDSYTVEIAAGIGGVRYTDIDLEASTEGVERYSVTEGDPNSQTAEICWTIRFARGDWEVRTITRTTLACDTQSFFLVAELTAFLGETLVHQQSWRREIPRQLV